MAEKKYNLGVVSVSFRPHTPKVIAEAAKEAGLSFIEWGSDVHAPCRELEKLREIVRIQEASGIKCSSYGTYFTLGETPIDELKYYAEAAKILGTDILRLWCGTKCGNKYTSAEREALIGQCVEAAEIAEAEDVTLCMECHLFTFTEVLADAVTLMKTVDSPNFCMYWQPFQTGRSVEENLEYAEAIAPYSRHIHVYQWKGNERFSLDEGVDEWRRYLEKFTTPRTLLLEFMPDDKLTSLKGEAEALRKIIGEI